LLYFVRRLAKNNIFPNLFKESRVYLLKWQTYRGNHFLLSTARSRLRMIPFRATSAPSQTCIRPRKRRLSSMTMKRRQSREHTCVRVEPAAHAVY